MRTLKVKCPTWQHVQAFCERKLRRDKTLTIRVPFVPQEGSLVTIGLQLPDGTIMAIEAKVLGVMTEATGKKTAIRLHLHGMTDELLGQIRALIAKALGTSSQYVQQRTPAPPPRSPRSSRVKGLPTMPPAPLPEDAPLDEPVPPPVLPSPDELGEHERGVFVQLEAELTQLREFAANEVLGVLPDADVDSVRRAYFARTKHFHPDLFARYRSPAILQMAEEVFIHINRAYDRMRDSLVAAGRAVVAGPALMPHDGWLAALDDISTNEHSHALDPPESSPEEPATPDDEIRAAVDQLMVDGHYERAREYVADALHANPRDRGLRALYYVIGGKQALSEGDSLLASSQFEAALAHDRDCAEASAALEELRARGEHAGVFSRSLR